MYSLHRKKNGIDANITLHFNSEVPVASTSSPYPDQMVDQHWDNLYSPECQWRPCQRDADALRRPRHLHDHQHKNIGTRQDLCAIWPVLEPGIKPRLAGFLWPEEDWPNWAWFFPRFFLHFCHRWSFGSLSRSPLAFSVGDAWLIAQTLLEERWTGWWHHWDINEQTLAGKIVYCPFDKLFPVCHCKAALTQSVLYKELYK